VRIEKSSPSVVQLVALGAFALALMVSLRSPHLHAGGADLPGPASSARARNIAGLASTSSESCATCHVEIAREWSGSLHHASWKDPVFQKAYDIEPKAFCRGCHAPEADPASTPSAAAQDEGIGCVSCHESRGHVIGHVQPGVPASSPNRTADPAVAPSASAVAIHAVRGEAWLATSEACEGCHQFNFPKDARQVVPSPMQNTHNEWRSSSYASTSCQGCHMPLVEGSQGKKHHNHDFRVVGDSALLRRAIRASAERSSGTQVTVKVDSGWTGHAFPTGDMFRRVQVRAMALDVLAGGAQRVTPPVDLARTFRDIPVHPDSKTDFTTQRVEGRDTRIGAPGSATDHREVVLDVQGASPTSRVRWEVVYQRMMTPLAESFGVNQVEDELVLASGILEPPITAASSASATSAAASAASAASAAPR
jgi:hypothetical protein